MKKHIDNHTSKRKFFTETHEKFVESVPQLLKKIMDEKAERD